MQTLIVIDQPPYSNWTGRESLDIGFALAAFDQPVSLLFTGSGVHWLLSGQDGGPLSQKTVTRQLDAAGIFGVESLLADHTSCEQAGLAAADLIEAAELVNESPAFYNRYRHVIAL